MGSIHILSAAITRDELKRRAEEGFGDMIKCVVDVQRGIMAIGGELHADGEQVLLQQGSRQSDVWGINLYPAIFSDDWIEFDSMINLRPSQNNRSRGVEDPVLRSRISHLVSALVL